MYDFLIVGAGLYGATFARLATDAGAKCLVVDKRPHVGGLCYSERREGIDCHRYGPHIFHTSDPEVWAFVNRFADWDQYHHTAKAKVDGTFYSWPLNLMTMGQVFGIWETGRVAMRDFEPEPGETFEAFCLRTIGPTLYGMFYKHYTRKMWGIHPRRLPASIAARLPVRHTFDDRYFRDRWQAVPADGWGTFFERLLSGIPVWLNSDGLMAGTKWVVWSGSIDGFFGCKHGRLPYRTLKIQSKWVDGDYQGAAWVTHPGKDVPYTRTVEHKFLNIRQADSGRSFVTIETPAAKCTFLPEPMYPIPTQENLALYQKYREEAGKLENVVIGGRLGSYRYQNMDATIREAMDAWTRSNANAET